MGDNDMKKIKAGAVCLLSLSLLSGCTPSTTLIKSYTDTALSSKSLIINTAAEDDYTFFAEKLAVFPKNANAVSTSESTDGTEGTETGASESETSESDESKSKKFDNKETESETSETGETEDSESGLYEETVETAAVEEDLDAKTGLIAGKDTLSNIYGKNIYDRVYPASVTKIMTALLTMEKANFSDTVVFTEDMVVTDYGAKLCGFEIGDQLTVEQLFYGLLVYSGNDAANALAVHIAGSVEAFADMMNAEAKKLGCVDTHFVNPSGLHDNDHYTSAYDLYMIFDKCLEYDIFQEVIRQNSYSLSYKDAAGETVDAVYNTTNQYFLDYYDYPESVRVLGGKTGTTDEAGCCLILYEVDKKNQGYISVILGASDSDELYSEMNILLNKIPK